MEVHIKPLLHWPVVAGVIRQDVEQFMHTIASGEAAQSRGTRPPGGDHAPMMPAIEVEMPLAEPYARLDRDAAPG
ncbi:MAG: hypothetical protein ACREFY_04210 [Acetobacteraceae bacterium]